MFGRTFFSMDQQEKENLESGSTEQDLSRLST